MCRDEVVGDWYRGCHHFVKIYYNGERLDCMSENCALSSMHKHKAVNCPCPKVAADERRIRNMFHKPCDECRGEEFARRVGR